MRDDLITKPVCADCWYDMRSTLFPGTDSRNLVDKSCTFCEDNPTENFVEVIMDVMTLDEYRKQKRLILNRQNEFILKMIEKAHAAAEDGKHALNFWHQKLSENVQASDNILREMVTAESCKTCGHKHLARGNSLPCGAWITTGELSLCKCIDQVI